MDVSSRLVPRYENPQFRGEAAERCGRDADRVGPDLRPGALVRSRAPGPQAHWRLHVVLCRHVSGEHQSLSPAPPAGREFRGLGESWERKLLHRLEIRTLRIRQGGTAVRATLPKL